MATVDRKDLPRPRLTDRERVRNLGRVGGLARLIVVVLLGHGMGCEEENEDGKVSPHGQHFTFLFRAFSARWLLLIGYLGLRPRLVCVAPVALGSVGAGVW